MSSDPAIGLRLGSETRLARSHPAGIAILCSRTFDDALQRLARYKQLTCPEEIRIRRAAQDASVEFDYVEASEPQPDLLVDMVLSWILSIGRHGTDGQLAPLRVELIRPAKNRELLESHFGCRVHFKSRRNALIFRSRDLDTPFVTYNQEMLEAIGSHLESELTTPERLFMDRQARHEPERPNTSQSRRLWHFMIYTIESTTTEWGLTR